jgi:hypothetical protein
MILVIDTTGANQINLALLASGQIKASLEIRLNVIRRSCCCLLLKIF